jgi:hypothetical protein
MVVKLAEIEDQLETLKILLLNLPDPVPNGNQFYCFTNFKPHPKKFKDFGSADYACWRLLFVHRGVKINPSF